MYKNFVLVFQLEQSVNFIDIKSIESPESNKVIMIFLHLTFNAI